jgi:hypothetical protein
MRLLKTSTKIKNFSYTERFLETTQWLLGTTQWLLGTTQQLPYRRGVARLVAATAKKFETTIQPGRQVGNHLCNNARPPQPLTTLSSPHTRIQDD